MVSWNRVEEKRHECVTPRCKGKCYESFCEKCIEKFDVLQRIKIWRHCKFYLTAHRRRLSRKEDEY